MRIRQTRINRSYLYLIYFTKDGDALWLAKLRGLFITVFGIIIGVTIIYSINEAMLNLGTGMSEVFEAWAVVAIYIARWNCFWTYIIFYSS